MAFTRKDTVVFFGAGLLLLALGTSFAQAPAAPPRPVCTQTGMENGACGWNPTNGLGPGTRVVLSDKTGGYNQNKRYLRESLERLSQQYGFTLTRIDSLNDITEAYLSDAKVIIFSNGDGDIGGSVPSAAVRERVENFVMQRGWGVLAVHAACAFINTWPFLQDACVQQFYGMNRPNSADVYVVDSTVDGVGQGRRNPYTSFLLEGLPDRQTMQDAWFTWRGNPRTTHQYNRESKNKVMLLALDESTFRSANPRYPCEHYAAWTHTMGPADGVAIFYSPGFNDVYTQGTRAYGDTLLWRMLRYAAKDWCQMGTAGCGTTSLRPSKSDFAGKVSYKGRSLSVSLPKPGRYRVSIMDVAGKRVYREEKIGPGGLEVSGLEPGVYFVRAYRNGEGITERVLVR